MLVKASLPGGTTKHNLSMTRGASLPSNTIAFVLAFLGDLAIPYDNKAGGARSA
jgi:hypothetical protein